MPVVVPPSSAATSTAQSVPTQQVFDYELDSAGKPRVGIQVIATLTYSPAVTLNPVVSLQTVQQQTTTDQNGYYTFNLIPNPNITPANTVYTIQTPSTSLDISVPSTGGPFQTTQIAVSTPAALQPAITGLVGPIAVTGNETVSGTLAVSGATTLAGTTTGALTTAAASIGGDLTILSAFRLLFGAAVAKIVGGATSTSIRDSTDSFDNLLVSAAGLATARAGLTATAGPLALGAGAASLGSVVASRYVGSWSTFGPPTGLTAAVADFGFDGAGVLFVCTVAGTPGTWATSSPSGRFHAEVYLSANQTISTGTTTIVAYDTVEADPNGNITTGASFHYTCPVNGRYRVTEMVLWSNFTADQGWFAQINKNGSIYRFVESFSVGASGNVGVATSTIVRANASDTLDIRVNQGTGGNQTLLGAVTSTYAQFEYVGPL